MLKALKHVYENIGEFGSLSSTTMLGQVTGFEKRLAAEYLQNE